MDITTGVVALSLLIVLSGFFSGIEAAFLSLNRLKIRRLVDSRKKNADVVKRLKDDMHRLIITLLIGNNLVNIGASAIATALAIEVFRSAGVGIATGVMTFVILIFGEIVPKSFAIQHAEKICLLFSRPIMMLQKVLYPVIAVFDFLTKKITRGGRTGKKPEITEDELKSFVEIGEKAGTIESDERKMIHNIFRLNDLEARDVMTPKINMKTVNGESSLRDILDFVMQSRHSRLPVYDKNPDSITGIIVVRELLNRLKNQELDMRVKDMALPALFVPETKKIDELLREMQKKIQHLAIVVDEYGVICGLVTIEDILEEIVGEIYDESDLIEENVIKIDKNTSRVKGETSIEELNRILKTDIPVSDGYDTISGYVLKHAGRIPKEGEVFDLPEFRIHITRVENNRIAEVRLVKK